LHASQKLKLLRTSRNLTARQVEEASRRIAAVRSDKRFYISNSWLTQLEKGISEPSICKLFSLSAIYQVKFDDLVRLYGVHVDEIQKYYTVAMPQSTKLLSRNIAEIENLQSLSESPGLKMFQRSTTLLPANADRMMHSPFPQLSSRQATRIAYGYIGLNDMTMYPMIRPGSLVRIDTSQSKLQSVLRHNQFERPIYFVELRNGYTCSWCELQGNDLLIIPHHSSPGRIRRFTYIKEAEIVGRVIGFDTACVDEAPAEKSPTQQAVDGSGRFYET